MAEEDRSPLEEAEMSLSLAENAAHGDDPEDYPTDPVLQVARDVEDARRVTMWATLASAQALVMIARHLVGEEGGRPPRCTFRYADGSRCLREGELKAGLCRGHFDA